MLPAAHRLIDTREFFEIMSLCLLLCLSEVHNVILTTVAFYQRAGRVKEKVKVGVELMELEWD